MSRKNPIPEFDISSYSDLESGISAILESGVGIDLDLLGEKVALLLGAHLTGQIRLSSDRLTLCSLLFRKLVPDAPKRFQVEHRIDPGEYIGRALRDNPDSFRRLQEEARVAALRELELSRSLYEYNKGLGLDVGSLEQA